MNEIVVEIDTHFKLEFMWLPMVKLMWLSNLLSANWEIRDDLPTVVSPNSRIRTTLIGIAYSKAKLSLYPESIKYLSA